MTQQTLAQTAAGTKLFIGTVNVGADDVALAAEQNWTEIGEVTNLPEFGKVYTKVEHKPIAKRATFKFKGGFDNGSVALDMARSPSDTGQALCIAALDNDNDFNFKVEFNDEPAGSPSSPTTLRFCGKIMSYTTNVGTRDGIIAARVMLEIDGDIQEAAAA